MDNLIHFAVISIVLIHIIGIIIAIKSQYADTPLRIFLALLFLDAYAFVMFVVYENL